MVFIDAVTRQIKGVLGKEASLEEKESLPEKFIPGQKSSNGKASATTFLKCSFPGTMPK